jgi:HPt (histidine-containing phosphotransfer) domain-containing protein
MNTDQAIAKLTEELDAETVADLIEQFLSDTPAQIAVLREAAGRADLALLGRTAHSLAGSSGTFGLQTMREAALALEEAALAGERARIPEQIEALANASAIAMPEIKRAIQR